MMNFDGRQNSDVDQGVKENKDNKKKYALEFIDEDDICDMNEDELMGAPLTLITRDVAMRVESTLLRENKPAVQLKPYKFNNYYANNIVCIK